MIKKILMKSYNVEDNFFGSDSPFHNFGDFHCGKRKSDELVKYFSHKKSGRGRYCTDIEEFMIDYFSYGTESRKIS
jgi:hypothetical protein